MAEGGQSERSGLGKFVKNQTRYGTTSKLAVTNELFLKHYVIPGETLQGIALKHGSTMEKIKRANNIWTNDSLFLREYLLIPLEPSPMKETNPFMYSNGENSKVSNSEGDTPGEIVTKHDIQAQRSLSRSNSGKSTGSKHSDTTSAKPIQEVSAKDFLNNFDSTLQLIKSNVERLEQTSNFPEDGTNPLNYLPSRKGSRYGIHHRPRSLDVESEDPTSEPDLVFKSKTKKRQIQSSLERLEKTQDAMFQL